MAEKRIMMVTVVVMLGNPRGRNTKWSSPISHESTHKGVWHHLQPKPLGNRFVGHFHLYVAQLTYFYTM